MLTFRIIWFVLLCVWSWSAVGTVTKPPTTPVLPYATIPNKEHLALLDIFNTTDGPNWLWRNTSKYGPKWFDGSPHTCNLPYWQGITCQCNFQRQCNVVKIQLPAYRLSGVLPASISNFSLLTNLDLSQNDLNSTIPSEFGQLEYLNSLILEANLITGSIPSSLGNLELLSDLRLSINFLSNTIPSSLGQLWNLSYLALHHNSINGTIPESLYSITALEYIFLYNNHISGTISSALGNWTNLKRLDFGSCWLKGSIPTTIGRLSHLVLLNLHDNSMTGKIPEELYTMQYIVELLLSDNFYTGTISNNINNMTQLDNIDLAYNNLTGTIPATLGLVYNTQTIYFNHNRLNGSIPESVYNLYRLRRFYMNDNELTGTLSDSMQNLTALTELYVENNHLNGTIPMLGVIPLVSLSLSFNEFTGTIPDNIAGGDALGTCELYNNFLTGTISEKTFNLTTLGALYIQNNYLSGPIPSTLLKIELTELVISNNMFTSTLPLMTSKAMISYQVYENQFTGTLPHKMNDIIVYFEVDNNLLTGSISPDLFPDNVSYQYVTMQKNLLTGSIPDKMDKLTRVELFDVSNNMLSGTLPEGMRKMANLQQFFINKNSFSGSVTCFDSTVQHLVTNIELSNNQFTGPIPTEPFLIPYLQTFAAVSNCFSGTIPAEVICNASSLTALVLDGLHTASSCQVSLLPHAISTSYGLTYKIPGSIPSCLFNLSLLDTLHISGNGMTGTLPSDVTVGSKLMDFALSYNQFSGTIPINLVEKAFDNFDLSYNRLTGVLPGGNSSAPPPTGTVKLNVNRLSGRIPLVLRYVFNIDILDGNIFECNFERDTLPIHDEQYNYYECGTSALQWATYSWTTLFVFSLVLIFCLTFVGKLGFGCRGFVIDWFHQVNKERSRWMGIYKDGPTNIILFGKFLTHLRKSFALITIYILIVLLPIYAGISTHYGMYTYRYAWNVSSVYLSGTPPAMILLVFLILFLCWFFGVFYKYMVKFVTIQPADQRLSLEQKVSEGRESTVKAPYFKYYRHYLVLSAVASFNFVIVLLINVGYVILTTRYDPTVVVIAQIILAVFKLVWNDLVIRGMSKASRAICSAWDIRSGRVTSAAYERSLDGKYMTFNTYLMILNIIIIPCLATAFVSSDCFYNIIKPPSSIDSSYSYKTCAIAQTIFDLVYLRDCTDYQEVTVTTSYLPPFQYRYQCSSTLITTYAELYVYKYIIAAFGQPLLVIVMNSISKKMNKNGAIFKRLHAILPQIFFSIELFRDRKETLFFKDRFSLRIITYTSVFVTFGVIFPPLAVMICLAVIVQSYLAQFRLGYLIDFVSQDAEVHHSLLQLIENDVTNTGDIFKQSLVYVGPVAAVFYAFIIFDTYGDEVGAFAAIWAAVVMHTLGCALSFVFNRYVNKESLTMRASRFSSNSTAALELKPMSKTANPLREKEVEADSEIS